uniref:CRISPR type III-B/RAMP module-associated protein Cmr5 n=1 Tax=Caenorhabditis tropicalis TaxID=1561998 RepID=A0A1I7SZN9_9PELO
MGNCIIAGARSSQGIVPSSMYSRRNSMELIAADVATKHAKKETMIRYFRCIEEIEKTTLGIVNIFNDAVDCFEKNEEYKHILESLQTRLFDLHQSLCLLFKLSVYKVDFSVPERKELAQEMLDLVKKLWKDIKDTFEGNRFGFIEMEKRIDRLVKKTADLTRVV